MFLLILLNSLFCFKSALTNTNKYCPGSQDFNEWRCDHDSIYSSRNGEHSFCDFDVIEMNEEDDLATKIKIQKLFSQKYMFKKPVLFKSSIPQWNLDDNFWRKDILLSNFGNYTFEGGRSVDNVKRLGNGEFLNFTLKYYISRYMDNVSNSDINHSEAPYIFDRSIFEKYSNLLHTQFDAGLNFDNRADIEGGILFIGVTGTGTSWHSHGNAWCYNAFGRKRWFLYPPHINPLGGFWSGYSSMSWFNTFVNDNYNISWNEYKTDYNITDDNIFNEIISNIHTSNYDLNAIFAECNNLYAAYECVQDPGDILYIPEYWWHSTLNIGNSLAVSIQTDMDKQDVLHHEANITVHRPLDPHGSILHYFTAKKYIKSRKSKKNNIQIVIKNLQNAIIMDSTFIEAYFELAQIYNEYGFNNLAIKLLKIAYQLNKNHPQIRNKLLEILNKELNNTNHDNNNNNNNIQTMIDTINKYKSLSTIIHPTPDNYKINSDNKINIISVVVVIVLSANLLFMIKCMYC